MSSSEEYSQGVVPYILTSDAAKHIEWMKNTLGGVEKFMYRSEDGKKLAHGVVAINGGCLYLTDISCEKAVKALNEIDYQNGTESSEDVQPSGFFLSLEVEDPDAIWKKAMSSGCTVEMELKVQFWGDLFGMFKDPFNFTWAVSKPKENKCRRGVVPYILTRDGECNNHIEWLKTNLGAEVKEMFHTEDGNKIMHCTLEMNGYAVYLADQTCLEEQEKSYAGKLRCFHCHLNIAEPKTTWERVMNNGAKSIVDLKVQFWGGLQGTFEDTFGCRWSISPPAPESDNYDTSPGVLPYLLSPNCQQHIDWIKNVFDGEVKNIYHTGTDKKVMHCSMKVNGGEMCLADQLCNGEDAEWPMKGDACGFMCHLDLRDPDDVWKKAMANGATQVMELKKQFWGDYYGIFKDPLGYGWSIRKGDY